MKRFFSNLLLLLSEIPKVIQLVLYVIALIFSYKIWFFFTNEPTVTIKMTSLMGTKQIDQIHTSGGQSANIVTFLNDKSYNAKPDLVNNELFKKNRKKLSFCIYDNQFIFGFKNKEQIIENISNPERIDYLVPSILAVNTIKSEAYLGHGIDKKDRFAKYEACNEYLNNSLVINNKVIENCVTSSNRNCLKKHMKFWLKKDKVLKEHLINGTYQAANIAIASILNKKNLNCLDSKQSSIKCNESEEVVTVKTNRDKTLALLQSNNFKYDPILGTIETVEDNSNDESYSASSVEMRNAVLMMTYSTIVGISKKGKLWILPGTTDYGFAIRRDISRVSYGTDIPLYLNLKNGEENRIDIDEPDVLSIDRWNDFIFFNERGSIDELEEYAHKNQTTLLELLNQTVLNSLNEAITQNHKMAVSMSKMFISTKLGSTFENIDLNFITNTEPKLKLTDELAKKILELIEK